MKKGLTVKQKKIILGLATAGITIPPVVYILYKYFFPDGNGKCVSDTDCSTGYECISGECKKISNGDGGVECNEQIDQTSCLIANCQWVRETETIYPWTGVRKCFSKTYYPYTCEEPMCRMGFKIWEEKQWHNETFHPSVHFEIIDGVGLTSSYCGVNRASRMTFTLSHERYIQNISGSFSIQGSAPWGATCNIKLGFYLDGIKIHTAYHTPGNFSFNMTIGDVGYQLLIVLEEISNGCCTYWGADPPKISSGTMTFTVGLI